MTAGRILAVNRSSHRKCSVKLVFLETSQNLNGLACNFIKKRLWYSCFNADFAKFLRISFFIEHLRWLTLREATSSKKIQIYKKNMSAGTFKVDVQQSFFLGGANKLVRLVAQTSQFHVKLFSFYLEYHELKSNIPVVQVRLQFL